MSSDNETFQTEIILHVPFGSSSPKLFSALLGKTEECEVWVVLVETPPSCTPHKTWEFCHGPASSSGAMAAHYVARERSRGLGHYFGYYNIRVWRQGEADRCWCTASTRT